MHAPEAGQQQQRLEGGRVAGPPGSAAPLLARVQLLCRDMSSAGGSLPPHGLSSPFTQLSP